ncbi:MAG: restriction endonuclease subunit S [Candidatus Scalindua sediminis]|nr:restriction endonuclease subunit S [Candidatus Scalindua sediminis]
MKRLEAYKNYHPVQYDYVSELPEGWQLLPNIAIFQERIERGFIDEELLSVTIGKGVIKQSDLDKKDSSTLDKSKYLLVHPRDLVYSMRFRQGASGYSMYKGIVSPACTVLRPKRNVQINAKYFYYMFRTGFYKNYVERYAYGIADGQIPLRYVDFKRMYSIVPLLVTQNAIVAYLDNKTVQIQDFIRKKERLIELLEEEKTVIINRAVTKGINPNCKMKNSGIAYIGEFPEHWEILKLRFLGTCQNGISIDGEQFGYGFPFVSYSDVYKNMSLPKNISGLVNSSMLDKTIYSVKEGDVFFTRTSETIEEIALASTSIQTIEDAVFAGFLIRFRPKKNALFKGYSRFYFRAIIHRAYFVKEVDLVTRASLSQELLKGLPVLLPSLEEQEIISKYLEKELIKRDNLISEYQKQIEQIKECQESLISNVVTGKLKVPAINKQTVMN